jgi:exopolysaccharide/PEP-CTERM locus tyrosine autokinase
LGKIFDALQKSTTTKKECSEAQPAVEARNSSKKLKPQPSPPPAGPRHRSQVTSVVIPQAPEEIRPTENKNLRAVEDHKIPIPTIDPVKSQLVTYYNANSFISEQFRMLRTNILFPPSGKPPRTILVTSALPNEGKSFIASNLALAISQNIDKHVLLLDCDMRKPNIHSIFGYDMVPGLSTYLTMGQPLQKLILRTAADRLRILPAGPPPKNPSELLSSNRMADLIREVKKRYADRFILIDSPPPHLTAETTAIARLVDGIVLVVKVGNTNRSLVQELVEKMGREKILGVVTNWLKASSFSHYGKGKYAKYGKYDQYGSAPKD